MTITVDTVRKLVKDGKTPAALQAIGSLKQQPGEIHEREILILEAQCHAAAEQWTEALGLYDKIANTEAAVDEWTVIALENASQIYRMLGDTARAGEALEKAGNLFPEIERARLARSTGYQRNRAEFDRIPNYQAQMLDRLRTISEAENDTARAAVLAQTALFAMPDGYDSRGRALKSGQLTLAAGDAQLALFYFLHALSSGWDRCYTAKAAISDNQRQLDAVAGPPSTTHVLSVVEGINRCEVAFGLNRELSDEALTAFARKWHRALSLTYGLNSVPAVELWKSLALEYPEQPWQSLCRSAIAAQFVRQGHFLEASKIFSEIASAEDLENTAYADVANFGSGIAVIGGGNYAEGAALFSTLEESPGLLLRSRALIERARCAEFLTDWRKAVETNERIIKTSPVAWHRRHAEYALQRIAELKKHKSLVQSRRCPVTVLPDDRTTRGNWPIGYGTDTYTLCAQNYLVDRIGGGTQSLHCTFRTTSSSEPGRLWVSKRSSNDPVALWDPVRQTHIPANRDDYGEQHTIGTGPDLIMKTHVPDGAFVLSLYFANDHNYYEPNRYYTVSVADDRNRLLAVTDVRDFGGGVYKRFALQGPIDVNIRIWRNLSINTLLSGVFLDSIVPPNQVPQVLFADSVESVAKAAAVYNRLQKAGKGNLLEVICSQEAIKVAQKLLVLLDEASAADNAPALLYMLSECQRFSGRARDSDVTFEQMLAALCERVKKKRDPDEFLDLAQQLASHSGPQHLRRISLFMPGTQRFLRLWQHYLDTVTALYEGQPARLESVLREKLFTSRDYVPAAAKSEMLEKYADLFPEAAEAWNMQHCAGLIAERQGEYEKAAKQYEKALAGKTHKLVLPRLLHEFLILQVKAGRPQKEIDNTWNKLMACGKQSGPADALIRSGFLWRAQSYINAEKYESAMELFNEFHETYGADARAQSLLAICDKYRNKSDAKGRGEL